jgi:hypothetical protein
VKTPPGIRFDGTINKKRADGAEAPNEQHTLSHNGRQQPLPARIMKCRVDGEHKAPECTSITMCGCCEWWYEGISEMMPSPRGRRRTDAAIAKPEDQKGFHPNPQNRRWYDEPPGRKMMPKNITFASTSIKPGRAFA